MLSALLLRPLSVQPTIDREIRVRQGADPLRQKLGPEGAPGCVTVQVNPRLCARKTRILVITYQWPMWW